MFTGKGHCSEELWPLLYQCYRILLAYSKLCTGVVQAVRHSLVVMKVNAVLHHKYYKKRATKSP